MKDLPSRNKIARILAMTLRKPSILLQKKMYIIQMTKKLFAGFKPIFFFSKRHGKCSRKDEKLKEMDVECNLNALFVTWILSEDAAAK